MAEFAAKFWFCFDLLKLEYTAGKPIEEVKALYPAIVDAFEGWYLAKKKWQFHIYPEDIAEVEPTPVELGNRGDYLNYIQLIALGMLFHDFDALQRIAQVSASNRGEDTIVEDLLRLILPSPSEGDVGLVHYDPYNELICAAWEADEKKSKAHMSKFLKRWYKFYKNEPWHDAHMRFGANQENPDWANYYGYWAFEAAAMVYMYKLDDSSYREHSLYLKDLLDCAVKTRPAPQA